jgi:hypothetical protein
VRCGGDLLASECISEDRLPGDVLDGTVEPRVEVAVLLGGRRHGTSEALEEVLNTRHLCLGRSAVHVVEVFEASGPARRRLLDARHLIHQVEHVGVEVLPELVRDDLTPPLLRKGDDILDPAVPGHLHHDRVAERVVQHPARGALEDEGAPKVRGRVPEHPNEGVPE